jgi:hypothetical protein
MSFYGFVFRLKALLGLVSFEQKQNKLVRARHKARAEGIGPGDPRYPDLWDVVGYEPPATLVPYRKKKLDARKAMS